jgi:predicted O-linked N-acetylglucosamine transferase (SPINDLY family)
MPSLAETFALGLLYSRQGNHAAAILQYQQVLRQKPDFVDAYFNLGNSLRNQGKPLEALKYYQEAVRLKPDHLYALVNLGGIHLEQGNMDEAADRFQDALRVKPDCAEALTNLANVWLRQGKLNDAVACYRQAVEIQPLAASNWYNLGNALKRQDNLDDAIACYRKALQLKPEHAETCNNLASAVMQQDQLEEAIHWFQEAIRRKPSYEAAYYNWGNALVRQNKLEEAVPCFQQALALKPAYAAAHNNLGHAWLRLARSDLALQSFRQALHFQPDLVAAQSSLVSLSNYDPEADPDTVWTQHREWGRLHEGEITAVKRPATGREQHANQRRRLRIGYVSPDFRFHPVARYFEPVLQHHDANQFEIFCYAEVLCPDVVTARLKRYAHAWRNICGHTDDQVANCIQDDQIDILVDLAGHTADNRLLVFARKPAPVQVTWLGYMNTTGLTAIDYRLTDANLDPPGQSVRDTEELLRLPGGMCCFAPPADAAEVSSLPALRQHTFTFGSLNNLSKLNTHVYDLWAKMLHAIPAARLLLFHHSLTPTVQEHLRREFADRGIADERVELRCGSYGPGYLGVYGEIDVSLDTFPCTGGVTTCESLWMGVPVISLCGVRPASRNSAALLMRAGLEEWVVQTPEQYIDLATRVANDRDRLALLRSQLRDRVSTTLCDAPRFTKTLEDAYRTMWRRWCES